MFNKQRKIITTFVMSLLMICLLASPAFAGSTALIYNGGYLCTISGQTATPGMKIDGATNVTSGSQHIELVFDHNVASTLDITGTKQVLSVNQANITLMDTTTQTPVSISVYRLGDGTPTDPEKQHLFFDVNLVSNHSYEITLGASMICYNGNTLGTTQYVDFTAQ